MTNSDERQAIGLANVFRRDHGLGLRPIKDLFETVHAATGVDVFSIEADDAEHGLTMLDPQTGRRVIVVATTPNPMRQRSSIAHELGHLLRGDLSDPQQASPGERSPAEICADAFARHLLLPVRAVRDRLGGTDAVTLGNLADLVQEYEISPVLAAIQMRRAGMIDESTCAEWSRHTTRRLAARFGWLSQYDSLAQASSRPRAPQSLMKRAVAGYQSGVLGIGELAAWYGESPETLRGELGEPRSLGVTDGEDLDAPLFPTDDGDAVE